MVSVAHLTCCPRHRSSPFLTAELSHSSQLVLIRMYTRPLLGQELYTPSINSSLHASSCIVFIYIVIASWSLVSYLSPQACTWVRRVFGISGPCSTRPLGYRLLWWTPQSPLPLAVYTIPSQWNYWIYSPRCLTCFPPCCDALLPPPRYLCHCAPGWSVPRCRESRWLEWSIACPYQGFPRRHRQQTHFHSRFAFLLRVCLRSLPLLRPSCSCRN